MFGFPDITPIIQIAPQGIFAFDKNALMFRLNHPNQIHNDWDFKNLFTSYYSKPNRKLVKDNLKILTRFEQVSAADKKLLEIYYRNQLAAMSLNALNKMLPDNYSFNKKSVSSNFLYKFICIINMLKAPVYSLRLIFKPGRLKRFMNIKSQ